MSISLFIIIALILSTVGVLITGVAGMAFGGEFNKKYANQLMLARVILQGLTLLFIALLTIL